jgi:hypothetical protein
MPENSKKDGDIQAGDEDGTKAATRSVSWVAVDAVPTHCCCRVDGEPEIIHSLAPESGRDQDLVIWNDTSGEIYQGATVVSPFAATVCVLKAGNRAGLLWLSLPPCPSPPEKVHQSS